MSKPIFLKVIAFGETNALIAVRGQKFPSGDNKGQEIEHQLHVVPRVVEVDLEIGEYWATESLTKKKSNWYVAGKHLYKMTDEIGIIQTSKFENSTHEAWCDNYTDFSRGSEGTEFANTKKTKVAKEQTLISRLREDRKLKPPTIEDDAWYVDEELWYYLIRNFKKKKNMLMIGASGAGKTDLVQMMINKINKNLNIFDMAVTNPNKTFCGNLRAEKGSTYYQLARFATKIQDKGLILMDELSRAAPTANNLFLPVLDKRRTLYIEDAINEADREIKVNDDCCFWATANIGAEFIGTSTLDHALLNRFQQVGVEYPPKDKESLLMQKIYDLSAYDADVLAQAAHDIRANQELSKDISTRQLFEVADMVKDGYSKVDAFTWTVLQQFEGDMIDGGERSTVRTIIQAL